MKLRVGEAIEELEGFVPREHGPRRAFITLAVLGALLHLAFFAGIPLGSGSHGSVPARSVVGEYRKSEIESLARAAVLLEDPAVRYLPIRWSQASHVGDLVRLDAVAGLFDRYERQIVLPTANWQLEAPTQVPDAASFFSTAARWPSAELEAYGQATALPITALPDNMRPGPQLRIEGLAGAAMGHVRASQPSFLTTSGLAAGETRGTVAYFSIADNRLVAKPLGVSANAALLRTLEQWLRRPDIHGTLPDGYYALSIWP